MATETRTMQLWPHGGSLQVERDGGTIKRVRKYDYNVGKQPHRFRKPTAEELRQIKINEYAELYQEREILFCDSMLVSELLKLDESRMGDIGAGDLGKEFTYENVKNLRPDPSDWGIEQCHDFLMDRYFSDEADCPDPNPWAMDHDDMITILEYDRDDELRSKPDDELRKAVIEKINDELTPGLDDWREAVRDHAEDAEIYEWWRVTSWFAGQLDAVGECVLDNAYGTWWGRCTTGQAYIMDGVLQRVAELHVD
jgi:hypothetical protein